ncbi:MAG: fused MFS/spermidine synthase [Candidatus Hydrogenedentes bacterium]|nr:fused MFS/spermidine synthase [Candidatus Hydrogenedentota bacterium]
MSSTNPLSRPSRYASLSLFLAVLLFFLVSGACGLLYQVVWTRSLVLLFGTTSYAVSTVLSIFFLGLGIGSVWGGRIADRARRPLLWYGVFEIAIGVWALLFILFIGWGESLVVAILQMSSSSRELGIALRGLLAAAFLIVPVTLMGTTLPLLAKAVVRKDDGKGRRVGLLYGVNTFGAVTGCFVTGFYFIEHFGYTRTTLIGAVANVAVGIVAIALANRFLINVADAEEKQDEAAAESAEKSHTLAIATVFLAFALSGFCALALEVLWTRMLTIVFTGTTYAYTTMLTSLLCGIASGSFVASWFADRRRHPVSWFGAVQVIAGIACLAMLTAFARMPERFKELATTGGYNFDRVTEIQFILSFSVLFVPTFFFGVAFPFAVRAVAQIPSRLGRDVGRLYALNTFAGVLGALAGGYFVLPRLGAHDGIVALGLMLAATGVMLILACPTRPWFVKLLLLLVGAGGIAATWRTMPDDAAYALNKRYIPEDHRVIHYKEGVEGTVVVSEPENNLTESDRVLWINSVQATQSIEKGVKMNRFQGVLPLLFDRQPKEALFMCFGSGVTAGTLGLSDFERIDAVEIAEDVLHAAPFFAADNLDVLDNPKLNFIVDDGRNFLLTTENRYDLITFEPMPLAVAGVSTFYTREFYEECLEHLSPGGLVSQWVPLHSLNLDVVRSLVHTIRSVFPHYCVWFINSDLFVIASNEPLRIDYANAKATFEDPAVGSRLQDVGIGDLAELLCCFFMTQDGMDNFAEGGGIMVDDRPWAEFIAPRLIYESTVADSLMALRPHYESPLAMMSFDGVDSAAIEVATAQLGQRHASHSVALEGVISLYASMVGGNTDDTFMRALDIDPHDYMALSYLKDIAGQRMTLFVRWDELADARAYYDRVAPYLEGTAEIHLIRSDLLVAEGDTEAAAQAYAAYRTAGGGEHRAFAE